MKLTKVKGLVKAPDDGVTWSLVLSPNQLRLDGNMEWVGSNVVSVNVWRQEGEKAATQEDLGDFRVDIFADAATTPDSFRRNNASFSFQASKSVHVYKVKLKVGDNYVAEESVGIYRDGSDAFPFTLDPSHNRLTFSWNETAAGFLPDEYSWHCGYVKSAGGTITPVAGTEASELWSIDEKYEILVRLHYTNGSTTGTTNGWVWLKDYVYLYVCNDGTVYGYRNNVKTAANKTTLCQYVTMAIEVIFTSAQDSAHVADNNTFVRLKVPVEFVGKPGETGAGIKAITAYYLATTLAEGVTRSTDAASWTTNYQQATPDLPYVWKYTKTTYTDDRTPTYSDCELIFSYSSGANPNLLEQTAFSSLASMTAWHNKGRVYSKDGMSRSSHIAVATGTQAHNAIFDYLNFRGDVVNNEALLEQRITGSKKKLEPGTWYTLSFYCKGYQKRNIVTNVGGYGYGIGGSYREVWLERYKTYRIHVHGRISRGSNTAVSLRTFVWGPLTAQNPWATQQAVDITAASDTWVYMDFRPTVTGLYGIQSYIFPDASRTGSEYGYVNAISVWDKDCLFVTHVYDNIVDTAAGVYVDGVKKTANSDGYCGWPGPPDATTWERHTYTFRTKDDLNVNTDGNVLWRIPPAIYTGVNREVYICMPKLEVGMQATSYIGNENTLHTGQLRNRRWAVNTQYFCGAPDEKYDDSVLVGTEGFYHCIRTHVSTESTKPGTGASWSTYWEKGSRIENLATDIFLAKKALVENLIASMVQTGYEGEARVEMFGSIFQIFGRNKTFPSIELADRNGIQVLRFYDQEASSPKLLYDLGPTGIESVVLQETVTQLTNNYVVATGHGLSEVAQYASTIFDQARSNSYTSMFRYAAGTNEAKVFVSNRWATIEQAMYANGRLFSGVAGTSGMTLDTYPPFTGLLMVKQTLRMTENPWEICEGDRWAEGAQAIPDNYNPSYSPPCDFTVNGNNEYVRTVYYRTVYHYTDGIFDGSVTVYSNTAYN